MNYGWMVSILCYTFIQPSILTRYSSTKQKKTIPVPFFQELEERQNYSQNYPVSNMIYIPVPRL